MLEDMKIELDMMEQEYEFLSHEKDSLLKRLELLSDSILKKQHEIYLYITEEYDGDK